MPNLKGEADVMWGLLTIFLAFLFAYLLVLPFMMPKPTPKECCSTIVFLVAMIFMCFKGAILATANYIGSLDKK